MQKKKTSIFGETLGLLISLLITVYLLPRASFVTSSYSEWLPIGVISAVVSYVIKLLKISATEKEAQGLKAISLLAEIYSVYNLYFIFPFDFSTVGVGVLNWTLRFAFGVSVIGMIIAFIIHLGKSLNTSD
ncbi:MAG: hypothetical protein U0525_04045 [Patescibacteria group bacterium]